jgi:hypothetical protein
MVLSSVSCCEKYSIYKDKLIGDLVSPVLSIVGIGKHAGCPETLPDSNVSDSQ